MTTRKEYVAIIGPTASGKSKLAMHLGRERRAEIISCDSIQVYRGFDIGSAKPTAEEQRAVPHHLIDLVNWDEPFDAALYARLARSALRLIHESGRLPIIVGGTGLYLRSLWEENFHADLPSDLALRKQMESLSNQEL